VLFLQCACFSFQQLHPVVGNNYMSISFESHAPSSTHWIHLKNTLPLHQTLGIWCSHPSPSPPLLWNSKNVETLHLCVSWSRPTPSLCGHQWHSRYCNGFCLRGPHIWVDRFQRFGTYMNCLSWEWMPNLFPQLACFTNFWHHLFYSKFGKTSNKILFLHELKTLEINMANSLVPNSNVSNSFSMCE